MARPTALFRPWLIGATLAATLFLPRIAMADSIRTVLDGSELTFNPAPIIEHDRTLVPVRGLLEALGAKVGWDASSRTVTADLGSTEIKAVIGSTTASVNGQPVTLEVSPEIVADHTLIPLRFFAESLGMGVSYDSQTRTISIDSHRADAVSRDGGTFNRRAATAVLLAQKEVGAPYAWGGTSPSTGFDCSGLVTWIAGQVGTSLPRSSEEMWNVGTPVTKANLLPGDLLFFATYNSGPSHVGVYIGNGKFVSAQTEATGVKLTDLANPYWAPRYLGARRVFR